LNILYDMETAGVVISCDILDEMSKRYEQLVNDYKQKIFDLCGCEFNLNSPAQLGQILYEKLGLTAVKKKKTGKFSTSAEVLEKLDGESPVIGYILKYRLYQKLYSTYLEGFKPLIDKKTGLVHTTYNQNTTATGRLSSANPNLQNIPIRENEGRELRKLFVPREGNIFIDADYSQIELRLLAHFSGCKELIDAYEKGIDIHTVTAAQVFDVPMEEVTSKMRREAKAVNFGIIYGMSDFGLSRNLDIPLETARGYIEKYFATYSAVKDYMNSSVAFAKENGYVSTLTGRKRVISEINSSNYNLRQFGERAAMNMPLQGSSADIIKIAMINVYNSLIKHGLKAKLILQVHDELVLDCPENEAEKAAEILKYEMENAVKLKVPLTVEVHSGKNWYDAK
ncbi:MAG: DNA polymerase I, partial [Clostridia bacterium]|nr:DNA polymerase I [Clostridia bacterium]